MPGAPAPSGASRVSRIVAGWRAHPALVLLVAVLALAAGYIIHADKTELTPATTASAVVVLGSASKPRTAKPKPRDTVVWRDEAGAIYRATVGGGRLDPFLAGRKDALETARTESREAAAADLLAALKPVFADMTARVPDYAGWYFGYTTKYLLMAQALPPAIGYLGRRFDIFSSPDKSLVQAIGPQVVAYLEAQYAQRVVRPREAEIRLRAAFDKSYATLRVHWQRVGDEQRTAMRAFIREKADSGDRLSAEQAAGLELDWDGAREAGSAMHQEGMADKSFRRGLLSVRLMTPKSAKATAPPDISEKTPEEADEITHVIVNLFDKLIGPLMSQMGDLTIGVFAGGAASGTTVGFGMAGPPVALATGLATAVPIGAAIGLGATVVAEMLSNRLEESLNRTEFEESLLQTVAATENAVETGMISILHEHVEAWYADIVTPAAIRTSAGK
jgi:hypothetical protein